MWTKSCSWPIQLWFSSSSSLFKCHPTVAINLINSRNFMKKTKETPKPPPEGDQFDRITFDENRHKEVVEASRIFQGEDKTRQSFLGKPRQSDE